MPMTPQLASAAIGIALLLGLTAPAEACSLAPFPDIRSEGSTYFVGIATPDTARAGPGSKTFYPADARLSDPLEAPERPVYGQVVTTDRIGGRDAEEVRRIAERFDDRVIVVPWGYRADCRATVWTESTRWVEPGARGMYTAGLRPPEQWVDGQPTFDVLGWHEPYPHARFLLLGDVPADSLLTADQFYSLYSSLPLREAVEEDPDGALETLREWTRVHPHLEPRRPVPQILESARHFAAYTRTRQRLREIDPPMRGTYRLIMRTAGGASRELFIRTAAAPASETHDGRGYHLQIHAAFTVDGIADGHAEARRHGCDHGRVHVAEDTAGGGEAWAAGIDPRMLARCFPDDPGIVRAGELHAERLRQGDLDPFSGAFRRDADGEMNFEQSVREDGVEILRIEGVRISRRTLP